MDTVDELRAKARHVRAVAAREPDAKVAFLCLVLAEAFERLADRQGQNGDDGRHVPVYRALNRSTVLPK
jgi:hypothetical protein